MKNKKIRRISIVMSLLLLFNNLGIFASDSVSQDEVLDSSLTEQNESVVRNSSNIQSRMGKYYSDFSDANFYTDFLLYEGLQNRANCYGYAFRMFYAPNDYPGVFDNLTSYSQVPGEFAIKSNSSPLLVLLSDVRYRSVTNYSSLRTCYTDMFGGISTTNEWRMKAIVQLMNADAAALGYTVTEYTGNTIPSASTSIGKRLIAVAVSEQNYHFYMQHSDDTWSHKRGNEVPQNNCFEHPSILNNNNIIAHACEGELAGGELKFFYITKDAITDCSHANGTSANRTQVYMGNVVGNHRYAAQDIGSLPEDYLAGDINHPSDVDYYMFCANDTEARTIYLESTGHDIRIRIYDSSGVLLASQHTTSSSTFTVNLVVDQLYYIAIDAFDYFFYDYGGVKYYFS